MTQKPTDSGTPDRKPFELTVPFGRMLGLQGLHREPGHVILGLDLHDQLCNRGGYAHGGVVMTMLDVAMSIAARNSSPDVTDVLTIEMKINMIATGRGTLRAEALVTKAGKSIAFMEGSVFDGHGHIVARAIGTWRLRRAKKD